MSARELGHELTPVEVVRDEILSLVPTLPVEARPLDEAHGTVLREDLVARELVPPFDASAMDGFALRASDIAHASPECSVRLTIAGEVPAGHPTGRTALPPSSVWRIYTGGAMPPGVDAVVPHELTRTVGEAVEFSAPIDAGKNVRRAGGDMKPGDRVLRAGDVLHSARLAIAATLGCAMVPVTAPLRVAVLSPGDELVPVEQEPGPGQIRNSNAHALAGAIREAGAEPIVLGIAADDEESIAAAIGSAWARGAHACVSSGGVSAGDYDFVREVVRRRADPARVFKVAMRPGKPLVFGLFDGRPFFGLPGNPASAIVSFEVFVRPALRRMRGESDVLAPLVAVRFPFEFRYRSGRTFYLRACVAPDAATGELIVAPPGDQDSGFLGAMARSNALVVLPADEGRVAPGERRLAFFLGSAGLAAFDA